MDKYLIGENDLWLVGGVDAVSLDGDQELASVLEVEMRVLCDDTGLIGLCDVGEDYVDHADQEAIVLRLPGVVDDGDDVGAFLGHVDQVSAHSVRELNSVDDASGADDVGNVGDSGARGAAEVKDLAARDDAGLGDAANN